MSADPQVAVVGSCRYCGRANSEGLTVCPGCGTGLMIQPAADAAPRRKKSVAMGVALALLFGAFGLFYASRMGGLVMLVATWTLIFGLGVDWRVVVLLRLVCVAWAWMALARAGRDTQPVPDAAQYLEEAARLEGVDRERAIAAYGEVIRYFPGTAASAEAERNIATLRRAE